MFLLNVNAKYLWTKLIFSRSSQFLLFSPILVIFSHFLTLSNGMQLSNRILHSPRHSWGIGPLRCPQRTSQHGPGHILLFHSPKSHCHYQHIWEMTVKLQLNTQSGTEMPWRQDVTETWLCLLHSCALPQVGLTASAGVKAVFPLIKHCFQLLTFHQTLTTGQFSTSASLCLPL